MSGVSINYKWKLDNIEESNFGGESVSVYRALEQ